MIPPDAIVKGAAALVAAGMGALILAAGGRDRAATWLSVFLGLIALNQGAEVARSLAGDPATAYRVATVAASLDPVAFWVFVHLLARGAVPTRSSALVLAAGGLLALGAGWSLSAADLTLATHALPGLLALYTVLVYAGATVVALRALAPEPTAARWRSLVMACALLVPAQAAAFADQLAYATPSLPPPAWRLAFSALLVALASGALVLAALRTRRAALLPVAAGLALGASLLVLAKTLDIASALTGIADHDLDPAWVLPGRASASLKWLVFGVLVSRAVFRHGALHSSTRARRRAARGLVAVGFLVAAVIGLAAASVFAAPRGGVPWAEASILLVAVLLSQAFQRLVDKVAARVYGVPARDDTAAAHELYRRAAAAALAHGRLPARDPEVQRLREELSIDVPTAALLERLAEAPATQALQPGAVVAGRYRIERLVGRGTQGRVFLAHDLLVGRDVVVKALVTSDGDGPALREARLTGSIADPHVITVFDVVEMPGQALIVMEHARGGTLAQAIDDLPPRERERVLLDVAAGLAAAHARRIVHGDVKPANVLLTATRAAKLADFGLARLREGGTVGVGTRGAPVGTPAWMSPEQRRGEAPTTASDVYALGLLGRWLLPSPPPAWDAVLHRALATDPRERWPDARAMLVALHEPLELRQRQ